MGAEKYETTDAKRLLIIAPDILKQVSNDLFVVLEKLGRRPVLSVTDEIRQPDRRALDHIIFDILGLTQGERDAVYEAVVDLVQARLEKARSVKGS